MEEGRNIKKKLTGKFSGRRPLRRPREDLENNIRMNLKAIGVNVNWINSTHVGISERTLVDGISNVRV